MPERCKWTGGPEAGADGEDYRALREETTARDRSLHEKVMSLEEAAALVSDGDHVAVGGCTMSRTPIALIWALIRAGRKDLTVSRSIVSTEGDLLYGSGASRHIITSWFSQGIVWGVSKVMRHYTEADARNSRNGATCPSACAIGRARWACPSCQPAP